MNTITKLISIKFNLNLERFNMTIQKKNKEKERNSQFLSEQNNLNLAVFILK